MPLELILFALVSAVIAATMSGSAERFYDFLQKVKDDRNPALRAMGFDDREAWIRRYRKRIVILYGVIVAVVSFVFFRI